MTDKDGSLSNRDTPSRQYADELQEILRDGLSVLTRLNRLSLEEIKRAKGESDPVDLARVYYHLRTVLEAFKEHHKNGPLKTFSILAGKDFPNLLEDRGMANVPLRDLDKTIAPSVRTYCKVLNKDECVPYLQNHEEIDQDSGEPYKPFAHIPQFAINAKTLGAVASTLAKLGKQLPEFKTDDKGKKILDENGLPVSMFETGHINSTTWRVLPKKKG